MSTTIPRVAAYLTGAACIALGAVTIAGSPVPDHHWGTRGAVVNGLGLLAFAAMALALELLRKPLQLARLGHTGMRLAQVGLSLMCVESSASEVHGGNTLGVVFMLGLLAAVSGLALVCADGLRRRRWLAALPLLALVVGIGTGDHGGFLLVGLVWLVLASINKPPATDVDHLPAADTALR